jgi:hypothetical protein
VKKRPRGKSAPGKSFGVSLPGRGRAPQPGPAVSLQYKVVELSTVDEGAIEDALNEWTQRGWALEGIQFAMRESSKRPAMAFVFFTRAAEAAEHDDAEAQARLRRLAGALEPRLRPVDAMERLAQLASDDAEPES